jgi:hypothetical protein
VSILVRAKRTLPHQGFDDIGDAFGPEVLVEDPVTHVVKFTHPHAIRPHVSASNSEIK